MGALGGLDSLPILMLRSTEDLVISFNGGKDCTVLLHLYAAVLARRSRGDAPGVYSLSVSSLPGALSHDIPAVYIFQPDPFDEVERFIATSADLYRLGITRVSTAGVKEGFQAFKEIRPSVSAILVGVRRTDPFSCAQSSFSLTVADPIGIPQQICQFFRRRTPTGRSSCV